MVITLSLASRTKTSLGSSLPTTTVHYISTSHPGHCSSLLAELLLLFVHPVHSAPSNQSDLKSQKLLIPAYTFQWPRVKSRLLDKDYLVPGLVWPVTPTSTGTLFLHLLRPPASVLLFFTVPNSVLPQDSGTWYLNSFLLVVYLAGSFSLPRSQLPHDLLRKVLQASSPSARVTLSHFISFIGLTPVQSLCLLVGSLVDDLLPSLGCNPMGTMPVWIESGFAPSAES